VCWAREVPNRGGRAGSIWWVIPGSSRHTQEPLLSAIWMKNLERVNTLDLGVCAQVWNKGGSFPTCLSSSSSLVFLDYIFLSLHTNSSILLSLSPT